jgi:hypothetical protein
MIFHVRSPVAEIPELSVGAHAGTDPDRLLHWGGDSLQWDFRRNHLQVEAP